MIDFFGGGGWGGANRAGEKEWSDVFGFENNRWFGFDIFIWHMGMEESEWSKIWLSMCFFVVFIP